MSTIEVAVIVGSQVIGAIVIIATLRSDVRWLKHWADRHEAADAENFRDLRGRVSNLGG